jgi:hypothetical protein
MNYTFFAISCYIILRATEVLAEGSEKQWPRRTIKVIAVLTLYAAISSLIMFYHQIWLLGFDPSK